MLFDDLFDIRFTSFLVFLMAVPFHFAPTEPKKKEERHQHFSSTDIAASLDSLIGLTVAA